VSPTEVHAIVETVDDIVRARLVSAARSLDECSRVFKIAQQYFLTLDERLAALNADYKSEAPEC